MKNRKIVALKCAIAALGMNCLGSAFAGTFVYVSNQHDGDISAYELVTADAPRLNPISEAKAANLVMPMAASPDGKFLYAAVRAKPFALYSYRINAGTGELQWINTIPMPDSMVSISVDQTGKWLLGAAYGGDTISTHRITASGTPEPDATQFFKSGGSKPHAIKTDLSNSTVYVPHLGTDEVRRYGFNAGSDKPIVEQASSISTEKGFGPRHFAISPDQ
ncbi:lactonase family protein [Pollutimonas subterranea]|nr:beta-propeller fold lactonase family protein [Pollutimonas subterranea]